MKKCVSDGPVSPMPQEWWNEILAMIPQDLIKSPAMQPYIQELYDELMKEYDKSMRKAMGMHMYFRHCLLILYGKYGIAM